MKKLLLVIWIIAGVAALLLRYEGALFISWWMWIVYAVILLALIGSLQPDDKKEGADAEKGVEKSDDRELAEGDDGDDGDLDFSDLEACTDDSLSDVSDILKAIEEDKVSCCYKDDVKKAQMGDAEAQCDVANDYDDLGEKQIKEIVDNLKKSDPNLDRSKVFDELEKENIFHRKAVYWFVKSAMQGYAGAMSRIGLMYKNKDDRKALYWYKRAIEHGGDYFESCIECCLKLNRLQEAEMWGARIAGDSRQKIRAKIRAFYTIVSWYDEHPDAPNAREGKEKWLKKAADLGSADAQKELFELKHAK